MWVGGGTTYATPPISGNIIAFADSGQTLGSVNSNAVDLGDIDRDGDLDAIIANFDQGVKIWTNDGAAVYTHTVQTLGTGWSVDVALGDVDSDGDLDAFVTNRYQANKVWLNDGNGTFTDGNKSVDSGDSSGVATGDVDSDGTLDIFVTNYGAANTVWVNDQSGGVKVSASSTNPVRNQTGFPLETEDDLLKLVIKNNGVIGDPDLELNQISLDFFRSDCSTPLTSSEVNALIDYVKVRVDDGNDEFDETDTEVANVDAISLTGCATHSLHQ